MDSTLDGASWRFLSKATGHPSTLASSPCRRRQSDTADSAGLRSKRRAAVTGRPLAGVRVERIWDRRSVPFSADKRSSHRSPGGWFKGARLERRRHVAALEEGRAGIVLSLQWSGDGRHRGRRGGRHAHRTLSRTRHPEGVERERRRPALPRRRASSSKCADVQRRCQLAVGSEALTRITAFCGVSTARSCRSPGLCQGGGSLSLPVRHQLRPARPRRHAEGRPRRDGAGAAREVKRPADG